jgi:hypothetical protein
VRWSGGLRRWGRAPGIQNSRPAALHGHTGRSAAAHLDIGKERDVDRGFACSRAHDGVDLRGASTEREVRHVDAVARSLRSTQRSLGAATCRVAKLHENSALWFALRQKAHGAPSAARRTRRRGLKTLGACSWAIPPVTLRTREAVEAGDLRAKQGVTHSPRARALSALPAQPS